MGLDYKIATSVFLVLFISATGSFSFAALVKNPPLLLKYHNGPLLKGKITVVLVWYGRFTPIQRSIIVDFIHSLNSPITPSPSVASWWRTTAKYKRGGATTLAVAEQILDENCSLRKHLTDAHITALASKASGPKPNTIAVVLTAKDVVVDGFCMRCRAHGSTRGRTRFTYAWVGNSETMCPGQCAWPFHQPIYGPQTPPLVPPNADVGVDGMVINLASVLAGAVTNPFNNGYFQGPATAPLEAVSACMGIFGSGAYPGNPGRVLVDKVTGASYNAYGVNRRKYLLPAMWDPKTSTCSTLV